jgi:hypothetical protein
VDAVIPEVAAVVAAAKHVGDSYRGHDGNGPAMVALLDALDALAIRETRAPDAVTYEEEDRTWGEVTVGDEILSVKTRKWHEVSRTVTDEKTAKIKVNIKGAPQPIVRGITDPVRVKRGVLGSAADTFTLLWSAQTRPEHIGTKGVGPMIGVETEEEDE